MADEPILLLVEDNPDDEALTVRAFKKANVRNRIVVARDGVEALDYLLGSGAHTGRDAGVTPQVVLLDIKLPKIDGLEVLRRIRADARTKLLPVVILTSSSEERDMIEGYRLGANGYVRKPVDFNHFAEAVRHLGLYWVLVNQPPPRMSR
jgi:two-component system response regulator